MTLYEEVVRTFINVGNFLREKTTNISSFVLEKLKPKIAASETKANFDTVKRLPTAKSVSMDDTGMPYSYVGNKFLYNNYIRTEIYAKLEEFSIYNPDLSRAVANIKDLSLTDFSVEFSDQQENVNELRKVIDVFFKTKFRGGRTELLTTILKQYAVFGATSFETIPTIDLSDIETVYFLSPARVTYLRDATSNIAKPYQRIFNHTNISSLELEGGQYKPLGVFYRYIPLDTLNDSPYGIPPLVSALDSLYRQGNMLENISSAVDNMGLLGFLKFYIDLPPDDGTLTDEEYLAICNTKLSAALEESKKSLKSGIIGGFKNRHEFDLVPSITNSQGAKDLTDINDSQVFAGLKQDGLFFGVSKSTTETLARVILAIATSQIDTYQSMTAVAVEHILDTLLFVKGFRSKVKITFTKSIVADSHRVNESRNVEINNVAKLYNDGVISQDKRAIMLGFPKADVEEPREARVPQVAKPRGLKLKPNST